MWCGKGIRILLCYTVETVWRDLFDPHTSKAKIRPKPVNTSGWFTTDTSWRTNYNSYPEFMFNWLPPQYCDYYQHKYDFMRALETGLRICITLLRILIPFFSLMRIRIHHFTFMQIRILLLIKLFEAAITGLSGLQTHQNSPLRFHCLRTRPSMAPFWACKAFEFRLKCRSGSGSGSSFSL